jgi:hypothetical protein
MIFRKFKFIVIYLFILSAYGCGSSGEISRHKELSEEESGLKRKISESVKEQEILGGIILDQAKIEQQNEMYSKNKDTTYLYWLDNALLILNNQSKCNIYALNTLFKAGFKCPDVNVVTHDLMDTTRFNEYIPYIKTKSPEDIVRGDLVIWYGHVIIFDRLVTVSNKNYAQAWWAGTRQLDNGENIFNNVIFGKYPLEGYYVVRRPVKM